MKNNIIFNILLLGLVFLYTSTIAHAKTLNFAVAADVHYSPEEQVGSRNFTNGAKALRGFVDRVNENNYDFVVFAGDNIDKSKPENIKGFLNLVKGIKTPYYLVLGNHDVHKISGMPKDEYLTIVSKNNKNQKKPEGSYYFYPNPDIIVIVLDNVSSGMPGTHGIFNSKTLRWFDEVLTKNQNKKAIVFQHVPYVEPFDNPSHNILEKNDYGAILRRHNNVLMVCSGHYHKEAITKDDNGIYHVSAPALFEPPYYYHEIQINYDKKPFEKAKNFKIDGTAKPAI